MFLAWGELERGGPRWWLAGSRSASEKGVEPDELARCSRPSPVGVRAFVRVGRENRWPTREEVTELAMEDSRRSHLPRCSETRQQRAPAGLIDPILAWMRWTCCCLVEARPIEMGDRGWQSGWWWARPPARERVKEASARWPAGRTALETRAEACGDDWPDRCLVRRQRTTKPYVAHSP